MTECSPDTRNIEYVYIENRVKSIFQGKISVFSLLICIFGGACTGETATKTDGKVKPYYIKLNNEISSFNCSGCHVVRCRITRIVSLCVYCWVEWTLNKHRKMDRKYLSRLSFSYIFIPLLCLPTWNFQSVWWWCKIYLFLYSIFNVLFIWHQFWKRNERLRRVRRIF